MEKKPDFKQKIKLLAEIFNETEAFIKNALEQTNDFDFISKSKVETIEDSVNEFNIATPFSKERETAFVKWIELCHKHGEVITAYQFAETEREKIIAIVKMYKLY